MGDMIYRRLGRSGLQVSVLSFGSWVSFGPQIDVGKAVDCLAAAHEAGCHSDDPAEAHAGAEPGRTPGPASDHAAWPRRSTPLPPPVPQALGGPVGGRREAVVLGGAGNQRAGHGITLVTWRRTKRSGALAD